MAAHADSLSRVNRNITRNRSTLRQGVHIPTLIAWVLLLIYGAFVIWTASLSIEDASFPRQLLGISLGVIAAIICWRIDFTALQGRALALLVIDLVVIFSPYIPGLSYTANGMTGWIKIPVVGLTFQPVELAKLITIFYIADLASEHAGRIERVKDYIKLCVALAIPFVAVIAAGDLGSALVVFVAGVVIICMAGPRKEWVLSTIAILIGLVALLLATDSLLDSLLGTDVLIQDYQMSRITVFLNPEDSDSDEAYNLLQSLIAVGSGGFFGKGVGNATQSGEGFLPEAHTDFVFALLCEEFGFVGAFVLLSLFALLIYSSIRVASSTDSIYMRLVVVGIVGMWAFQVLEEVGMCIGLMPITGIPLPFISYGSSSMLIQCTAVGIVQSAWLHRNKASA